MGKRRTAARLLRSALKLVLYQSGALTALHRIRNRETLTVVTFHRVLPEDDPRAQTALREWTIDPESFDACLGFFRSHYEIVSLDDVARAFAEPSSPLPPRSLLLTFDDGYADNLDYALPLLRKHKSAAIVFVSSDMIGRADRLWAEDLLWAWQAGRLRQADIEALFQVATGEAPSPQRGPMALVQELVRGGLGRAPSSVERALPAFSGLVRIREPRQMLDREGLMTLERSGIAIGAHGKTHAALTHAMNIADELNGPRAMLTALLGLKAQPGVDALSFPHGAYTPEIVAQAFAAGYRFVFTDEDRLIALDRGAPRQWIIPRINIDGVRFSDRGRLREGELACALFFRPRSPFATARKPHGRAGEPADSVPDPTG